MNEAAGHAASDLCSIGDVAEATGISVDTIRVWERRYGRPVPVRLPSGHRRYTGDDVRWLRRVAEALARGHRPSHVVSLGDAELDEILRVETDGDEARHVGTLLDLVEGYRGEELTSALREDLEEMGPRDLLRKRVAPLLTSVGRAWADGRLEVRHEHFLTIVLRDFLADLRGSLRENDRGPHVLLATLAGEQHGFGLHMAAIVAVLSGARARILGTDTPNAEIVLAAEEIGASAVAVSISLATGGVKTDRIVRALRERLPEEVRLIVGGDGARGVRRGPRGVIYVDDLAELEKCLSSLVLEKSESA